ncbi:MAG: MFS transporter [Acidobacteria bacterium]|nr:MFS transporter [Acidobacteriota bacterium]
MSALKLNEYEKPIRTHYEILLMCWAGWVFDFYDLILYSFLLIPIGKELKLTSVESGWVFGASLAATALGGGLFGFLADKYGRKKVLEWTILLFSLGTFLSGFAVDLWTLILFRALTGFGVGGEWATGQTYIGETFPPKVRARYAAFMQSGAPVGFAIAAIVGGLVAPEIGWRACFYISILPALLVVFVRKRIPESDIWQERKDFLNKLPKENKEPQVNFWILFSSQYRYLFIISLFLAIFDMAAYWITFSWLPGYLYTERSFSLAKSAFWVIVAQVGAFLGNLAFGWTADKFGRRPAYTIFSFLMAIGLIMITLMWSAIVAYPALILSFMFLVGFGTGMFAGYGPLFAELYPTSIRNTAMGSAYNFARGIQFLAPVLVAVTAQYYGLSGGISLAAIFAILSGLWIWLFPETRGLKIRAMPEKTYS